jgi:stage II sporulation protein D
MATPRWRSPSSGSTTRWGRRWAEALAVAGLLLLAGGETGGAQSALTPPRALRATGWTRGAIARPAPQVPLLPGRVRVAIGARQREVAISAAGPWHIDEQGGRALLVRGVGGEPWQVEGSRIGYASLGGAPRSVALRVTGEGGDATPYRPGPFVARAEGREATLRVNGATYRGAVWIVPTDSGLLVINEVPLEDYLLGVVPKELGTRATSDLEALKAQAVAARSYAVARARERAGRGEPFDLVAQQVDQVYGGAGAETPVATAAVRGTAGEVLTWEGRVVAAPYSSTCGGRTAEPAEAWAGVGQAPWLRSVSDLIPGTSRAWCEGSPRFRWHMGFDEGALARALDAVARQRGGGGGSVLQDVAVAERTTSGRVTAVTVATEAGRYEIRGPALRAALKGTRGEMVASTAFSVAHAERRGGRLVWLELAGVGHGHGVGMCQWGAIGRARAGHDYRSILRTYYPGATLDRLD